MRGIKIILILLTIVLSSIFCRGSDLTPKIINGLYCFDTLQIRYVTKVVFNNPLKDSLITEQSNEIKDLNKTISIKDQIIEHQKTIISNDSGIIKNLERALENDRELGELKVSQEKHKSKKIKLIALGEVVLIILILIVK